MKIEPVNKIEIIKRKKLYFSPCITFYGSVAQLTTTGTGVQVENYVAAQNKCVGGAGAKKYCGI